MRFLPRPANLSTARPQFRRPCLGPLTRSGEGNIEGGGVVACCMPSLILWLLLLASTVAIDGILGL